MSGAGTGIGWDAGDQAQQPRLALTGECDNWRGCYGDEERLPGTALRFRSERAAHTGHDERRDADRHVGGREHEQYGG